MASIREIVLALCLFVGSSSAFLAPAAPRGFSRGFGGAEVSAPVNTADYRARVGPLMDGKSNALRDRITSVKNTKKITEAMRLVAAAKVRRAQDAVLQTRPFSETLQSVFTGLIDRIGKEPVDLPLLEVREVKTVTLVAISGDRGLCGSYNNQIIKNTESRKDELEAQGYKVNMVLIGTKVAGYMKRRDLDIVAEYNCPQAPTAAFATEVSNSILDMFLTEKTDKVELIYTKFVSLISSTPAIRSVLPLSATGIERDDDEIVMLTTKDGKISTETAELGEVEATVFPKDMIFEQEPEQIINGILPLYLNGLMLRALQEGVASELAARMTAMQSATDNASELVKSLSQTYNRARQASVTQEIIEVSSGAEIAMG